MPNNFTVALLKCSKMQDNHAKISNDNYTLASKLFSSVGFMLVIKKRSLIHWNSRVVTTIQRPMKREHFTLTSTQNREVGLSGVRGKRCFGIWLKKRLKAVSETQQAEWQAGFTDSSHTDQALKALPQSTAAVDVILCPSSAYKAHSSKNRSSIKVIIFSLKQQDFLSGLGGSERGDHLIKTGILQRLKINEVFPAPLTLTFTERWGIFSLAASGSERRLRPAERGAACGDVHINHRPPSCQSGWTWLTSPWWSPSSRAAGFQSVPTMHWHN